jgi:hypothetical protein
VNKKKYQCEKYKSVERKEKQVFLLLFRTFDCRRNRKALAERSGARR